MDRINATGLPRKDLAWALGKVSVVATAVKSDSCLLCREAKVNESGLCRICYSLLSDEELALARKWLSGIGP